MYFLPTWLLLFAFQLSILSEVRLGLKTFTCCIWMYFVICIDFCLHGTTWPAKQVKKPSISRSVLQLKGWSRLVKISVASKNVKCGWKWNDKLPSVFFTGFITIDSLYFVFCMCLGGFQLFVGCLILDVQLVEDIFEWETTPTAHGGSKWKSHWRGKNHNFLRGLISSLRLKDGDAPWMVIAN